MKNRGKRGASRGSKDLSKNSNYIEFNQNNEPCGENIAVFMSEFNRLCDKHLQYYMTWKEIKGDDLWDHVWSKIKNIFDDGAKKVMRKKANAGHRKFRCTLHNEFVKTGLNPKPKYNIIDETKWGLFVSQCNGVDFQLQTEKSMLGDGMYFIKGSDSLTEVLGGEHGG